MRLPRVLYPGALYHVHSRGNNHAPIFVDDADRAAFLQLLRETKSEFGLRIYAYVLMPDHFDLLVETPNGDLGKAMQRLNQSYTRAFNRRHGRSGHLFENRYKCRLVQRERYLMQMVRFLHLTPVAAGLASAAAEYPYSSHGEYTAPRKGSLTDWQEILPRLSDNLDRACLQYGEFMAQRPSQKETTVLGRKRNGILGDREFKTQVRGQSRLATSIKEGVLA